MNIRTIASLAFSSVTLVASAASTQCGGDKPNVQSASGPQPTVAAASTARPAESATLLVSEADGGSAANAAPTAAPEAQYTVLKKGLKATSALAADGFNVYWVEDAEGGVTRMSKKGGAMMMFYSHPSGGFEKPSALVVDDASVYWTQHVKGAGGAVLGSVMMASKDGGAPTVLAQNVREELRSLALDAKSVYWLAGAALMRAPKAGGGATPLAMKLDLPTSVASDGKYVYWTSGAGTVMRMLPTPGSKPETVANDQEKPDNLFVDDANVFWTAGNKVMTTTKAAPVTKTLATSDGIVSDFAIDATHVYWVGLNASGDGVVMRAPKDGAAPAEKLASGQASPAGISVDKYAIYWSTRGTEAGKYRDGTLVMLPK